jgi:hypothetical protein
LLKFSVRKTEVFDGFQKKNAKVLVKLFDLAVQFMGTILGKAFGHVFGDHLFSVANAIEKEQKQHRTKSIQYLER